MKAGNLKASTLEGYRVNMRAYIAPHIGTTPLRELTPERIGKLYRQLLERGGRGGRVLRPKTVRNAHLVLRQALADAVEWGMLRMNPAALRNRNAVPKPEARQDRQRQMRESVWSAADLRRFLAHVREDRLSAAWLVLATTGVRRGELLGLRWSDVDLDAGHVRVAQTLTLINHVPTLSTAKTDAGARRIALDSETAAALREHRRRQSEERLAWGPGWQDTDLVFVREDGSLIHPERFLNWFKQRARAAGLSPTRLHDMRHAYASALLAAGVSMKVVSERLGHSGIAMDLIARPRGPRP